MSKQNILVRFQIVEEFPRINLMEVVKNCKNYKSSIKEKAFKLLAQIVSNVFPA